MSKMKWLMALLCAMPCSQMIVAQSTVTSIEDLFRIADDNSTSIQAHKTGIEAAAEAVKSAKARMLPDINVSASASYWGNGRLWDRDFSNGTRIDMPHFGNNFAIEAQQVIYAGGSIRGNIKVAELEEAAARLDWAKNRQEIRFLLASNYLELCKLDNQARVLERNIELTEQMIGDMQARRWQGTVLQNDITRYELQREDLALQLTKVRDACSIIRHQIATTLHLPDDDSIIADTTSLPLMPKALSEQEWQDMARQNNLDLQQSDTDIKVNEQRVKIERSERIPQIAVVAVDHLDGPITIEVPVLDNNFNYWYVGIGVKYNISSLFKNNRKMKQARLNLRRAQEMHQLAQEDVENAVQAGYTNFLTAYSELKTQEKSVQLANQNYDVVSNRYANELALMTDLLDASNAKLSAELSLVNARINLAFNYYKMRYLTHTL